MRRCVARLTLPAVALRNAPARRSCEVDQTLLVSEVDAATGKVKRHYRLPEAPQLPLNDPRDRHLPENRTVDDHRTASTLLSRKAQLMRHKYVFVPGSEMEKTLRMLGARDSCLTELRDVCDNMNPDPHLPFRTTSMFRMGFGRADHTARRLTREPFVLTEADGFKRKDSGAWRFFGEAQDWVMHNTAYQALLQFKYFMMGGIPTNPRPGCDPSRNWNMCGFFLRTHTTDDLLGEPALEGVHQDGVEWTMTTFFNSNNMRSDSARSVLYGPQQKICVPTAEADQRNVLASVQLKQFLDTLLFIDNELSHSVSAVHQDRKGAVATRDMGVFFTRRMAVPGGEFSAADFDSEEIHERLPFAMALNNKMLPNSGHVSGKTSANGS